MRMDFRYPVWVINLARSAERRAYITAHLEALGLPFEIVPAVDGRELTAEELASVYDPVQAVAASNRELTPGEIGCALSHLRLYRRMVDENVETALILEDDAKLRPGCPGLLAQLIEYPVDWELLLLYHGQGQLSRWHRKTVGEGSQIAKFAVGAFGTVGYLIRQDAARKILARALPLRMPIDHWTGGHQACGLRLYGIAPPCVEQAPPAGLGGSTIAEERDRYWRQWGLPQLPPGPLAHIHYLKVWLVKTYCKYHPWKVI